MQTGTSGSDGHWVRDATASDLPEVVRIHQAAFRGFFLDRMGKSFLRAYYSSVLAYDGAIFLVHSGEAKQADGFAVGFRDPSAFYSYFRSRRLRLAPIIVVALLRRPTLLMGIARNTRRIAATGDGALNTVELSSIGTSRPGAGIGSALLRVFCERSKSLGAERVTLTTDRDDNDAVVHFYLAHGFRSRGIDMRGPRVLQIMSIDLSSEA